MAQNHKELLQRVMEISKSLSVERDRWALYQRILDEVHTISRAEGSTLYLMSQDRRSPALQFVIARNDPLGLMSVHQSGDDNPMPSLPLYDEYFRPNHANVATHCALTKAVVRISDVASETRFDMSGVRRFDTQFSYTTRTLLSVPLVDHDGNVSGVIQLINTEYEDEHSGERVAGFSDEGIALVESLCSLAAVAIDNHLMAEKQRDLLITLSSKKETSQLFETILDLAQSITHAEGGTLYLYRETEHGPVLRFAIVKNSVLAIHRGGSSGVDTEIPDIPLRLSSGKPNVANIASFTALKKDLLNIADAYDSTGFDFSGTRRFDEQMHYRSRSILCVPLVNHAGDVIGVLQLLNARDSLEQVIPFSAHLEPLIEALSTYAAIVLENQILLEDHKKLLDAFIKCIASAIDAKSSHTSAHCQRIPVLTAMIARATCEDQRYFPDFSMSSEDWYELEVASWLHDCGKLSTPDRVLDKATKLQTLRDGIDAVNARFGILARDIEIAALRAANGVLHIDARQSLESELARLEEGRRFINRVNTGGEFMSAEDQARVREIGARRYRDVSGQETALLSGEEIDNLCIARGTLNDTERALINDHMRVTLTMLDSLPFPKTLRRVPEYAGGHHEKMDGTGFPRGLTREQMSLQARMMAIADVFEALTARERPYKPPMKLSQALTILQRMKRQNHIDPDLYQVFLEQRVWEQYAREHLLADQLDVTDIEDYR